MSAGSSLRRRHGGFTVIEIMVVVAILAVLAGVGAPQMMGLIKTSKVRAAASDFYSALLTARSEAVKRRGTVSVTPTGSTWPTGWSVMSGTTTLMTVPSLGTGVDVQINVPATTTTSAVSYGSNGRVTSSAPTLIFYTSSDSSVQARCVSVDAAGLPRIRTDTNSNATDGCN